MNKKPEDRSDVYFKRMVRPQVLALEGYSPGGSLDVKDPVILSANENGFGTPGPVLEAIRSRLDDGPRLNRYPDITCRDLRNALSEKYHLPSECFIVGNGLDDIINMLALTFLSPDDNVIIPAATFVVYSSATKMMGATPVFIPMRSDLSIDVDAIPEAVTSSTRMIFLCSPNNPTGTIIRRPEFDALLEKLSLLPARPLLIVDHAYADFARDDQEHIDAVKYLKDYNNIAVLRTFSKISGLAGLRVGYMIAHPGLISYMYRVRAPYTVNAFAQAAATVDVMDDAAAAFRRNTLEAICKSRGELENFLSKNGIPYVPSHANFVFSFYGMPHDELSAISEELAREGVLVRTLKHDHAPNGLRLTIGTPEENKILIETIKNVLDRRKK
jgi:histidinol-phosphate aminotransferase